MYAATLRLRYAKGGRLMDNWYHPLAIGLPLPTLPVWLKETWAIALELEASGRRNLPRPPDPVRERVSAHRDNICRTLALSSSGRAACAPDCLLVLVGGIITQGGKVAAGALSRYEG